MLWSSSLSWKLDALILISSISCPHTIVILMPTQIMRLACSRTHDGSLWPPHYPQTPLTGFSSPAFYLMLFPLFPTLEALLSCQTIVCMVLPSSPHSVFLSALLLLLVQLPLHPVLLIPLWSPHPLQICCWQFPPGSPFPGLLLPCKSACQERGTWG